MASFPSIRIEGGLLSSDLLDELLAAELKGQKPADFGLDAKRNLTDEVAAAFADARALWGVFQNRLAKVPADDPATTVTRDAWLIPFLSLLGYELRFNARAYEADGQSFAISHRAGEAEDATPIHLVGNRQELGRISPTGRPRLSPHSLMQEYLNRTDHVWGLVSNGNVLRILRDSTFVRRQAYIEFDLESIIEEQRFHDFTALYRLIHRTRLPKRMADAGECLLEQYFQHSEEQGGRVRDHLRDGVERCIIDLANGFLRHPANEELRERASPECTGNERLSPEQLFRQLLRLVYRFLFLLVSEERGLLSPDPIYRNYYGIARLRRLLDQRSAFSEHEDLAHSLGVLWEILRNPPHAQLLQLAPLNGELFDPQLLDSCSITNRELLSAFWHLAFYQERAAAPPRRVNYAALDVEELGSVYESLLEFHPAITRDSGGRLEFDLIFGSERKTTGSYYTPPELVAELIKSALEPVIEQRLGAAKQDGATAERALLSIRVCDPACGSGHFLLAAARRIAKELAQIRTGEEEPAPERSREAIRDVIAHCIYGVDRNPLAVDLCRVALWLESHTGTKPLTFLDHRIRCGDSLVGVFDLAVLQNGIPDGAFKPVEGDDRTVARALAKRNDEEKQGFQELFGKPERFDIVDLVQHSREVDAIPDDSPELIRRKKQLFDQAHRDPDWLRRKQLCDAWTAAFFQPLTADQSIITSGPLADLLAGKPIDARLTGIANVLSNRLRFFHWPLEFPEVFEAGGFDAILSNPPWETVEFKSEEHWADDPAIRAALSKAERTRLIEQYRSGNAKQRTRVALYDAARHDFEATSKFLRTSVRFPLTATGKMNVFALFAELMRVVLGPAGRTGIIVPTAVATDDSYKQFFADLLERSNVASLYDFENREALFAAVDRRARFCLLTLSERPVELGEFAFFCTRAAHLHDPARRFTLTTEDFLAMNPNTRTCPVFRSAVDAEFVRDLYRRHEVLINERSRKNAWGASFKQGLFNLATDSNLFEKAPADGLVPLYEGKMVWAYDHRAASVVIVASNRIRQNQAESTTDKEHADPKFSVRSFWWVPRSEVESQLTDWKHGWLLGFKDVTAATNERTAVFSILPRVGVGHTVPLLFLTKAPTPRHVACFLANANSIVLDYIARQKLTGLHLSFNLVKQLPFLSPSYYSSETLDFIVPRVAELVSTSLDVQSFAQDIGFDRASFRWDEQRRAVIRAELDALFARAYGLNRKQLRYILDPADLTPHELENILDSAEEVGEPLDAAGYAARVEASDFPSETFRVLKEKEIAKFGEYRTRRLVLEAWKRGNSTPTQTRELERAVH